MTDRAGPGDEIIPGVKRRDVTGHAVKHEPPTMTAVCEAGQCHRCHGVIRSMTDADGQQCAHDCHGWTEDLAVEARLERDHYGVAFPF